MAKFNEARLEKQSIPQGRIRIETDRGTSGPVYAHQSHAIVINKIITFEDKVVSHEGNVVWDNS